jgi:hypothetical protein
MTEPTKEQLEQEIIDSEARTSEHLRASAEQKATRLSICEGCESRVIMFGMDACSECNCILGFKVQLNTSTCPKGKW